MCQALSALKVLTYLALQKIPYRKVYNISILQVRETEAPRDFMICPRSEEQLKDRGVKYKQSDSTTHILRLSDLARLAPLITKASFTRVYQHQYTYF